jgi:hypothetical protein
MGTLTPGATYIYERVDGVVYAREAGKTHRKAIGWDYGSEPRSFTAPNQINWVDLFETAHANPALQKALDRVILLYQTIKEDK